MPIDIEILFDGTVVKSGESIQLQAFITGTTDPKEKGLYWDVPKGKLDRGKFTAPLLKADEDVEITVVSKSFPQIKKSGTIHVQKVDPPKIIPPLARCYADEEREFTLEYPFPTKARWFIANHTRRKGVISPDTGKYKAPALVEGKKVLTVKIVAQDYLSGERAEAEIDLVPIEMRADGPKRVTVHAGDGPLDLRFESHHDILGLDNFFVEFGQKQVLGLLDGRFYTPPKVVRKHTKVKLRAVSNRDNTKKVEVEVLIKLPRCRKCKRREINLQGECPNCGKVAEALTKPELCPRCKSSQWDRKKCPICKYPDSPVSIA